MTEILWIEPNSQIASTLELVLSGADFSVALTFVTSIDAAMTSISASHQAVVLDPSLLAGVDEGAFKQAFAQQTVIFYAAPGADTFIPLTQTFGVTHVMLKELPFNAQRLLIQLKRCLLPLQYADFLDHAADPSLETRVTIKNSDDITTALNTVEALAENALALESRMELCTPLLEAITNAVYHAPKKPNSHEDKYEKGEHIPALLPSEEVEVIVRQNNNIFGVNIVDQQGSLLASEILESIAKNHTDTGLFDESGRGFFLMHTLMDDLQITINPGVSANILMIKTKNPYTNPFDAIGTVAGSEWADPKPLFVNIL
jgi:anti-sigma regulatory factor (Ser/Thr protein kinase)